MAAATGATAIDRIACADERCRAGRFGAAATRRGDSGAAIGELRPASGPSGLWNSHGAVQGAHTRGASTQLFLTYQALPVTSRSLLTVQAAAPAAHGLTSRSAAQKNPAGSSQRSISRSPCGVGDEEVNETPPATKKLGSPIGHYDFGRKNPRVGWMVTLTHRMMPTISIS